MRRSYRASIFFSSFLFLSLSFWCIPSVFAAEECTENVAKLAVSEVETRPAPLTLEKLFEAYANGLQPHFDNHAEREAFSLYEKLLLRAESSHPTDGFFRSQVEEHLARYPALRKTVFPTMLLLHGNEIRRLRSLSLREGAWAGMTSYISSACGAMAENNIVFGLFDEATGRRYAHIGVILGEAVPAAGGAKVAVAAVNDLHGVAASDLSEVVEALRQSLLEKGYRLAVPERPAVTDYLGSSLALLVDRLVSPLEAFERFTPELSPTKYKYSDLIRAKKHVALLAVPARAVPADTIQLLPPPAAWQFRTGTFALSDVYNPLAKTKAHATPAETIAEFKVLRKHQAGLVKHGFDYGSMERLWDETRSQALTKEGANLEVKGFVFYDSLLNDDFAKIKSHFKEIPPPERLPVVRQAMLLASADPAFTATDEKISLLLAMAVQDGAAFRVLTDHARQQFFGIALDEIKKNLLAVPPDVLNALAERGDAKILRRLRDEILPKHFWAWAKDHGEAEAQRRFAPVAEAMNGRRMAVPEAFIFNSGATHTLVDVDAAHITALTEGGKLLAWDADSRQTRVLPLMGPVSEAWKIGEKRFMFEWRDWNMPARMELSPTGKTRTTNHGSLGINDAPLEAGLSYKAFPMRTPSVVTEDPAMTSVANAKVQAGMLWVTQGIPPRRLFVFDLLHRERKAHEWFFAWERGPKVVFWMSGRRLLKTDTQGVGLLSLSDGSEQRTSILPGSVPAFTGGHAVDAETAFLYDRSRLYFLRQLRVETVFLPAFPSNIAKAVSLGDQQFVVIDDSGVLHWFENGKQTVRLPGGFKDLAVAGKDKVVVSGKDGVTIYSLENFSMTPQTP